MCHLTTPCIYFFHVEYKSSNCSNSNNTTQSKEQPRPSTGSVQQPRGVGSISMKDQLAQIQLHPSPEVTGSDSGYSTLSAQKTGKAKGDKVKGDKGKGDKGRTDEETR